MSPTATETNKTPRVGGGLSKKTCCPVVSNPRSASCGKTATPAPFLLSDDDVERAVAVRVEQQRVFDRVGRRGRGVDDFAVQVPHPRMRLQIRLFAIRAHEVEAPVPVDVAQRQLPMVTPEDSAG
ncbi:hypothetical protein [Sorangium sp. So ce341]|uniref:hypothetical protein n=1 Tax=Sorangium sp. So ce341 TaxID=3133302 RepID=UPI003F6461EC